MLPDNQKGFAPIIRGIAKTNAQVTIRQNGYIIYQSYVAPGAFEISDLYLSASSGDMTVTIKVQDGSDTPEFGQFTLIRGFSKGITLYGGVQACLHGLRLWSEPRRHPRDFDGRHSGQDRPARQYHHCFVEYSGHYHGG